jgi:dipeptidyl aminopeptidase/acylaminoacyl peptidase
MTDERSLERAARSWLELGPTQAPDHAVDAALLVIQTTPQERAWHVPRRFRLMSTTSRLAAAATAVAVVAVAGAFVLRPGGQTNVAAPPSPSPAPSARPSPSSVAVASSGPSAQIDWSFLPGRLLVEHLGNAMDLSESTATDYNPDTRRFYFLDPKDMTSRTVTEFLKGQPATGKSAADISTDQKKIVFQDWADQTRLYEANLDSTGFRKIPIECTCALLYPDYDPTARKIVYVRVQGAQSWLEIRDLTSGATTKLDKTIGSSSDDVPEQPAWSPDGKTIAFSRLHWAGRNDPVVGTVRYGDKPPTSGRISLVDVATGAVTDVPLPPSPVVLPGDVNWAPDGHSLLFTHCPGSTTGSDAGMPADCGGRRINLDGSGYSVLGGWGGPSYTPDGKHILFQNNEFYLMNADGTGALPVNDGAMDVSELAQGFAYIGHWIDPPTP